ncbi:MAG: phenylalanine--tRNA ligase subunit alpha [Patescibacteria group bacterium]|jgi:phenylalanyl-tRNA synthetase alpha chain|nr:phenylalanine--tRNA ligase subunit alpha [Patescibacteria group bacterium]
MEEKIKKILQKALAGLEAATTENINELQSKFLGRRSELNEILKSLGKLSLEEKKKVGAQANKTRQEIEKAFESKRQQLQPKVNDLKIDFTAPGKYFAVGHLHPVTQVMTEILEVFKSMGYEIADGPEVEDDWHNFEALNLPPEHPARDMQDTFYLTDGNVLRTHTSPVQIRYTEKHKPPIKIVSPGRCYRNENEDASHSWSFHQIEGLVIDKNITFADLKGTLEVLAKALLGPETRTRFRPSFFPYTEPSAELDASCPHCKGAGCRSCGYSGWLELLGSGMVHPEVLKNMKIDPDKYTGFAFGLGPERVAAIKHEIPDVRYFWHPDVKFLEQF